MIVVDTSALMAILKNEPEADRCQNRLEAEQTILISAGTLTKALLVAQERRLLAPLELLLSGADIECVALDEAGAKAAAAAYAIWGKGNHSAKLNFGDCFAYDLAKERACPLLFIGNDFSQTDIVAAI